MSVPAKDTGGETIAAIGERLRELRSERGLSIREAAGRAGLSPSFLRLVERGESEISITRLMRLADLYGLTVGDLLVSLNDARPRHRFPLEQAKRIEADDGRVTVDYLPVPVAAIQPFRLTLQPGATLGDLRHATEEFFHCVEGKATLTIDGESFRITAGDTAYVPANTPHAWDNPHGTRCLLTGGIARRGG